MTKRIFKTVGGAVSTAALAAVLLVGAGAPAHADSQTALPTLSEGQTVTTEYTDQTCLAGLEENTDVSMCEVSNTLSLGEAEAVTLGQIKADKSLSSGAKEEIIDALEVGILSSNHWSQFTTGGSYTQTQNGTFYYNGSRVWVTQTYNGQKGSHSCFTNYVVSPWSISNISKSDSGSTASRNLYCSWSVNSGNVFSHSVSMTAVVKANGTISGFGATVG